MRATLAVSGSVDSGGGDPNDLRRWLRRDPELRARITSEPAPEPAPGAMGGAGELVSLLLEPGGVTAALGAAVVAWLQNRRSRQSVTITLPDGTCVTVSSESVRDLDARDSGELAQRVARALGDAAAGTPGSRTDPDPMDEDPPGAVTTAQGGAGQDGA